MIMNGEQKKNRHRFFDSDLLPDIFTLCWVLRLPPPKELQLERTQSPCHPTAQVMQEPLLDVSPAAHLAHRIVHLATMFGQEV